MSGITGWLGETTSKFIGGTDYFYFASTGRYIPLKP